MSRPRYVGLLGEHPVFRFDSERDLHRVWPRAERNYTGPFEPGLYMALPGIIVIVPRRFATRAYIDLIAACSSPRLVRSIMALDATRRAA